MVYRRTFYFIVLIYTLSLLPIASFAQTNDRSAISSLSDGLGDQGTPEGTRYLMFSYNSSNQNSETSFLYDWESGNCRFEGQTANAETLVVLFNTNEEGGQVFVDDTAVIDQGLLEGTRQSFQDDSYFLFMPIRIAKREVNAVELEPEIVDSKKFHVLQITTPRSKYKSSKIYIDFQNGMIYKWITYDDNNTISKELLVSKTKDVGGGLTLPTQFTDKLTGESLGYSIAAALLNIEPQKFEKP